MKKILSILLVLTMIFCLAACGGEKDPVNTGKPETPTTENTQPTEEAVDVAAKQAYYDKYFTSEEYKPAGNSFKATSDVMSMSQVMDANGYGMLEIAVSDYFVRIYRVEDNVYLHTHGPSEENPEQMEDVWLKYTEAEGENILQDSDMSTGEVELEDIKKVTYVETKDALDYVTVEMANGAYAEGMKTTEYDVKFTYEDVEYTVTLTENQSEGMTMNMWSGDVPDELSLSDYALDAEKKNLVHDEDETKNIACEVVNTRDVTPAATLTLGFYVDVETHKVVKVASTENGIETVLEYFNVEKYEPDAAFPENATECTADEVGMVILAMLMMTMQ